MSIIKSASLISRCAGILLLAAALDPTCADTAQIPINAMAGQLSNFKTCTDQSSYGTKVGKAQCATLLVLENRQKPKGRLIALPVVKLPAASLEGRDPMIVLNGGPGDYNLSHPLRSKDILNRYDIVLLGYRGADNNQALYCPEFKKAALVSHPLSEKAREGMAVATRQCVKRLEGQGLDLSQYRMVDVIEDYEELRQAMNIKRFNMLSVSYGTRIAQYYSRLHPESVGRSVQVGVNPPGHFQWSPEINHSIMELYSELCTRDDYCSSRTKNLTEDTLAVLSQENLSWQDKPIDMDRVRVAAFIMLMSKHSSVQLFDAVLDAKGGDTANLYRMTALYDGMVDSTIWGDLYAKGGVDYVNTNKETFVSTRKTTPQQLGSPLDLIYSSGITEWPIQPAPEGFDQAAVDKTETLLINGNLDMSTPFVPLKNELLKYLPNGHLVETRHFGHGDIRTAEIADEVGRLVGGFLDDGIVDYSIIKFRPVDFNINRN